MVLRRPLMRFGSSVQKAMDALTKTHPKRTQRDVVLVNFAEVIGLMADTAGGCGLLEGDIEKRPGASAIAFVLETFERRLLQLGNALDASMAKSMAPRRGFGSGESAAPQITKEAQGNSLSFSTSAHLPLVC